MKIIRDFYLKKFQFLEVKFSIYLNRRVFVMMLKIKLYTRRDGICNETEGNEMLSNNPSAQRMQQFDGCFPAITLNCCC